MTLNFMVTLITTAVQLPPERKAGEWTALEKGRAKQKGLTQKAML